MRKTYFCRRLWSRFVKEKRKIQTPVASAAGQAAVRASITAGADLNHAKAALLDLNQELTL